MHSSNPDSKSVNTQPSPVPGWRPAAVARLLRGKPRTTADALDPMERYELIQATKQIVRAKALPYTLVRIVETILDFANNNTGLCNPSCAAIAATAGCGARTVERGLPILRSLGILDWDNQWQDGRGNKEPPKKTSNSYTFARIALGHVAEFVSAKLLSPALEKLAKSRAVDTMRNKAARALAAAKKFPYVSFHAERKERGMADAVQLILQELRQPAPIIGPLSGTARRLMDHTKNAW